MKLRIGYLMCDSEIDKGNAFDNGGYILYSKLINIQYK